MWTAKRILIYVVGLFVCLTGFATYSLILGAVDGLRALPIEYLPDLTGGPEGPMTSVPTQGPDQKLEQTFGIGCKELQRPLRLWLPDKGIVFSAGDFQLDAAGRVRLQPFSAALYHKNKVRGEFPEISTIQCETAIFTLDQPATSIGDLNNRKVIAVEMQGRQPGISITNNRRTAEKNDDIDILITNGPLFYEERSDKIWTEGIVRLTDNQSKPPTNILGTGMEMLLAKDSGPNQAKKAKPRPIQVGNHDNGGVEKIKLKSDVHMHFWVDSSAGFLGGTQATKKPLAPMANKGSKSAPGDKAHIHIHTSGPFEYDLTKETAWFESPPAKKQGVTVGDPDWPGQVFVERIQDVNGVKLEDRLVCDRLDLQFRVAISPQGANGGSTGGHKEIETAKATKRNLTDVTLAMESEKLHAFGAEMFFRAGDAANGPLTILKGEPQRLLRASKDGHKIRCSELHLFSANRFGEGQKALAKGPGQIDLLDTKNLEKESFPTHLLWRDTLDVAKAKEGGQVFDLMTVVGEASFIDDVQKQELHGEKILVWILQMQESEKKPEAVGGKTELHRVLAMDRVRASSPDFIIRQTDKFTMVFLPEAPRDARLPDVVQVKKPAEPKADLKVKLDKLGPAPMPVPVADNKPPVEEKKPNRPIELQAGEIFARIASLGGQKELQELIAKGNVYVFQPGEKQGEKALDITGQLLTVKGGERGRTMVVYGDKGKLARLDLGDTTLWGPRVTINQADNRADIEGHGAMEMPSNKTLDGNDTAKKDTRIRIYWNKNMTFDGKYALFHGGVQAHEVGSHSHVKCEALHTILDKTVSFKEGQKDKQGAKIDRLVFDKNVFVDDTKVDDKKQFVQRTILEGREMISYQDGPTRLVGPGEVRLLAKGSGEIGPAPMPGAKDAAPKKMEWKLTNVKFRYNMLADQKPDVKTASFYGDNSGVEVFHFPTIDINAKMNADRPPKDGLYLRCEMLTVEERRVGDRVSQTMIAKQNVIFKTDQYFGRADVMKFDESKDIVILEGLNGNTVQLTKLSDNQPAVVNSTKVLYNRRTGEIRSEGVKSLSN